MTGGPAAGRAAAARPNVLFLIAHDVSLRFGCYGDRRAVTPHLDALAAGGALFQNAFCQYPLCAPARTCLMTGCRPETVRRYPIGGPNSGGPDVGDPRFYAGLRRRLPWIRTIPELLRAAGYRTRSLHKVLHEYESDPPSWSEPPWFAATGTAPAWCPDDFDCRERARRYRSPANRSVMEERFRALVAAEPDAATQFKRWRGGPVERAPAADGGYDAGATAAEAVRVLDAHAEARDPAPLFLGVGFCNTHLPWLAPDRYWRLHDATGFGAEAGYDTPRPAPLAADLAAAGNEPFQYYEQTDHLPGARAAWQPTPQQAETLRRGHYAAVSYLDAQIGRILAALDRTGLAANTVVVFTTDHGFALGEHRHWGKAMPWEPDLRVPLLLRAPNGPAGVRGAGARVAGLAEHVDLLPTLLELAGAPTPPWAAGTSLTPLLDDPAAPGRPAVYAQAVRGGLMAWSTRTASHRRTRWLDAAGRVQAEELYDHRTDPAETVNLAPGGVGASAGVGAPAGDGAPAADRYPAGVSP